MMPAPGDRRGVTLLELLAILLIVGTVASVVSLAVRHLDEPDPADPYTQVANARRDALADGAVRALVLRLHDRPAAVSVLPDGRVIADSALALDPLTGQRANAAR